LAFASVISSLVNGLCLAVILHGRIGSPGWGRICVTFAKVTVAAGVMGVSVHFCSNKLSEIGFMAERGVKCSQAAGLALCMLLGVLVYGCAICVLCKEDIMEVRKVKSG
jgi:peptidoglycan biosynthesis protein MviN/MurJ (putative lipid II flippase)